MKQCDPDLVIMSSKAPGAMVDKVEEYYTLYLSTGIKAFCDDN
jgi:hypothetical protein